MADSGKGLSHIRHQALIRTYADLLPIGRFIVKQILVAYESKYNDSHSRKCIWKCQASFGS